MTNTTDIFEKNNIPYVLTVDNSRGHYYNVRFKILPRYTHKIKDTYGDEYHVIINDAQKLLLLQNQCQVWTK